MKKINKTGLMMASFILLSFNIQSQELEYLSITKAVETAKEHNSNVKMAELERKVSNANFRQTDAIFLPQVELGYSVLSTNNPLNAFGFLLQQQTVTQMDFDPDKLNNPGNARDFSAKVEAKLPLLNIDMIYARKGAKAQEEMHKYKVQRTEEYIEYEVKKAYSQLQFSYEAQNILRSSLEDVKSIYQSVSNFYNQGLIQKSDLLNAQVQVNTIESALAKAESNIYNASEGLHLLMGTESDNRLYKTDSLTQNIPIIRNSIISTTRADFMALNKAADATNMMVRSSKMAFLPRINAFGGYQFNDDMPFKFRGDSYLVGVSLNWTIFSGNKNRSTIRSYRFQKEKIEEELALQLKQGQLDISKTNRELNDLQLEINKQEASVMQAEEALRIMNNRHKEGLVSTTDLLMSQAQHAQQKLQLAQAVMSYNIAQAYSEFLSR
ncbi:MAG: TolC family protein [Bacteroidales bacterium]|nr:TolC family protein [Bacteroidales bacterium]